MKNPPKKAATSKPIPTTSRSEMKILDLFSGIGGFSIAAHLAGFEVVAHCEIEPFPQAVLRHRFPEIPIFDDIRTLTKKSFYEKTGLKKIDIVCGGSPCQGFSVAGLQRGFGDNRSHLFSGQLRVARELGAKFIVWENVPGALSSNKGRDFARVLSEFTGWNLDARKWGGAGFVRSRTESDYSVTYRILDTRFFGIPQRRRRIYLVASLGSTPRPEILFEREGVRGNIASGETAGKNIAYFANQGIGAYNQSRNAATLRIGGDIKGGGGTLIAGTLVGKTLTTGNRYDAETENFIVFENNSQDSRIKESGSVAPTLSAKMGTGGNNTPICVHASQDPICSTEHAHALGVKSSQAVCIAENVIGRKVENGGNGIGAQEELSYTLNTTGVHGVAFSQNQLGEIRGGDISPTLNTNSNASGRNVSMLPDTLGVRRLTPLECERLQGFPDNWTRIPYRGKSAEKCPDLPRYKACGNAVTVDVAEWVLRRLAQYA